MQALAALLTPDLALLWVLVLLASWLQTLTGFAFGLILMGGVGMLGLIPLPQAAIISGILTIANGLYMLSREWRAVDRPSLGFFMAGSLPGLVAGYVLLLWLAGGAITVLQFLLGLIIIGASVQMMMRPRALVRRSPAAAFLATGFVGGVMGGMFSTAGPPVIWQMYRQPGPLQAVRATLLAVFTLNGLVRLALVLGSTGIPLRTLTATAGALPLVMLGTFLARRYPPPLSPDAMRRLAFGLLFLSGLALFVPALLTLSKDVLP